MAEASGDGAGADVPGRDVTVVEGATVVDEEEDDDELVDGSGVVDEAGDARVPPSLEQEARRATTAIRAAASAAVARGAVAAIRATYGLGAPTRPPRLVSTPRRRSPTGSADAGGVVSP